jgi:integrase
LVPLARGQTLLKEARVALQLYKTRYRNIKRNTKRALPSSTYYVVFDVTLEADPKKPAAKPKNGKKPKKPKKKYRLAIGQADPDDDRAMERIRVRGLEIMRRVKAPPAPEPDKKNLEQLLAADLLARRQKMKPSSIKRYELSDRTILAWFGAEKPIEEITADEIRGWILYRQQTVTNSTINRDLARLKMAMKWARKKKRWISVDPAEEVDRLRETDPRDRYLTDTEEVALWSVAPPWLWRLIWVAAMTGMRWGEQFGLRWDQIRDRQIQLRGHETKGGRPRVIPIGSDVQEILDQVRTERDQFISQQKSRELTFDEAEHLQNFIREDLVFVTEGSMCRVNPSNFARDYWRPARKAAGIQDFRWHDLRHTFCSWIVQGGGQLEKVQVLAGHANKATTDKYTHHSPHHLMDTMEVLELRKRPPIPADVTPIGKAKAK